MAEFGPKVFHALGYISDRARDNSFMTASPAEVGINETENPETQISEAERIEKFKNALFKIVMLRARDQIKHLTSTSATQEVGAGPGVAVNLQLNFFSELVHPETEPINSTFRGVRRVTVDRNIIDDKDVVDAITAFEFTAMLACGTRGNLDASFSNDPRYTELPG